MNTVQSLIIDQGKLWQSTKLYTKHIYYKLLWIIRTKKKKPKIAYQIVPRLIVPRSDNTDPSDSRYQ